MKRPETLDGATTKIPTGHGTLYVTVNEYEGRPFEVFATIGKSGGSVMAKAEVTGRLASLALRSGASVEAVIDQLRDISGENVLPYKEGLIKSIPDAVAQVLEKWCKSKAL